ncbi:glucuronokinase 1-like [Triticum dicoccoides]|uniref:glucuronokinase 1-like n=1 Tax=Triticum dicoccoides TaxID=85692 RepID=UPI00189039FE|nr:glucuronokinase 1-like [Triticum dicoccoides]
MVMVMQAETEMERRAYARVGLLGNPRDVYGGRTVSFTVTGLWATVRLRSSDQLLVQPHPRHDLVACPSLHALVSAPPPPPTLSMDIDTSTLVHERTDLASANQSIHCTAAQMMIRIRIAPPISVLPD